MRIVVIEDAISNQSKGQAFTSISASSTNTMNVSLNIVWKVVIDNDINMVDVYMWKGE